MKLLTALYLCLFCPAVLSAQVVSDTSTPPTVLILNYDRSLKMQRYLPLNWENLPESYPRRSYPMPGVEGLPSTEAPMKRMKTRHLFIYTVEIKNIGTKKIAGVVWEYVFIGSVNKREVARLQFRNKAKVAVAKNFTLIGKSLEPPPLPKVVNIEEIEQEGESPYREHVEIRCIMYADGIWWRHPDVVGSDCERLMSGK